MKLRLKYKLLKKKLEAKYVTPVPVVVKSTRADIERYAAEVFLPCDPPYIEESRKLQYLEQAFCDKFRNYIIRNMKIEKIAPINTFPYGMYPYQEEYRAEIMMIDRNKID